MTTDYCPHCGDPGLPNDEGEHRCVNVLCAVLWRPIRRDDRRRVMTLARALNRGTRRREGER
jgi:hypothetical protein